MWQDTAEGLKREVKFENFAEALAFVNKVGELAESVNHHPDIELGWGYVHLTVIDHREGKVTDKCHKLTAQIDNLLLQGPSSQ